MSLYERWASDWLTERTCAVMFCRFLETSATAALLPYGLAWLNAQVSREAFRYEPDVSNAIGRLLVILRRTRREAIIGNPQALQSLRTLLSRLGDIQHPRAVEVEILLANSDSNQLG
jgi:hypothetical protein